MYTEGTGSPMRKFFALAACCTGADEASVFLEVCNDLSFLETYCAGKHVWLPTYSVNMPRDRDLEYLQQYRASDPHHTSDKDPHHTSPCILVPMWRARRCTWRQLLKDMLHLRDFKHGYVHCLTAEPKGKARSYFVYHDAPKLIFKVIVQSGPLLMNHSLCNFQALSADRLRRWWPTLGPPIPS